MWGALGTAWEHRLPPSEGGTAAPGDTGCVLCCEAKSDKGLATVRGRGPASRVSWKGWLFPTCKGLVEGQSE